MKKPLAVLVACAGTGLVVSSLVSVPLAQQKGKSKFNTWTQYLGSADSSQYSSLDQINGKNVMNLRAELTFSTGVARAKRQRQS